MDFKFPTPDGFSVDDKTNSKVANYRGLDVGVGFEIESVARSLNSVPSCPFVFLVSMNGRSKVNYSVKTRPRPTPEGVLPQDVRRENRTFESYFLSKDAPAATETEGPPPVDPPQLTAPIALRDHLLNCPDCIVGDAELKPEDPGKLCETGRKLFSAAFPEG